MEKSVADYIDLPSGFRVRVDRGAGNNYTIRVFAGKVGETFDPSNHLTYDIVIKQRRPPIGGSTQIELRGKNMSMVALRKKIYEDITGNEVKIYRIYQPDKTLTYGEYNGRECYFENDWPKYGAFFTGCQIYFAWYDEEIAKMHAASWNIFRILPIPISQAILDELPVLAIERPYTNRHEKL